MKHDPTLDSVKDDGMKTTWTETTAARYAAEWESEAARRPTVAVGGFMAADGTAYCRSGERYYRAKEPMTVAEFRAAMQNKSGDKT